MEKTEKLGLNLPEKGTETGIFQLMRTLRY